ncbi:PREDICTED: probable protein phosphatase 2C 8 [Fragaria vesca subsp. vesca]|uniref:probable protein phosphatase 2C 8 n=1 Tax=Fragaria vesca subsp. vesca TaxID=101020 RepID=UPI0002C2ED44|nr:PREDICTED: probable protein phosphatase 2C 8 [Fragaria vesca subsp. vesca]
MESLNPQNIDPPTFDECFTNKRQRSIDGSAISKLRETGGSSSGQWSSEGTDITTDSIMSQEEEDKNASSESSPCGSYGSISVIGRRRAMKDAMALTKLDGYNFFAVYDGHGGSSVSNACRDRLHLLVAQEVEPLISGGAGGLNWEKVLASCFTKMDNEVGAAGPEIEGWVNTVGSSAVVAVVGKEEIVVANSGDSRAVLCRDGVAVPLSRDHKPDRPDEKQRVEAAGGRVIDWKGSRVLGVLSTSRSIGDHYLKPYVIAEPEVTVSKRTESCDFLLIASDGLWDVVSNECACQFVTRFLGDVQIKRRFSEWVSGGQAANAAALLAQLALARGSKDNITVIVVKLNNSSRQ